MARLDDYNKYYVVRTDPKNPDFGGYTLIEAEFFKHARECALKVIKGGFDICTFDHNPSAVETNFPKGQLARYIIVYRTDARGLRERIILRDDQEKPEIESVGESLEFNGDVYWYYEASGCHIGNVLKIAVKNQRHDFNTYGVEYPHDGLFYADTLEPVDDYIADFYGDAIGAAAADDYKESAD